MTAMTKNIRSMFNDSGLNFEVEKRKIYYPDNNGKKIVAPDNVMLARVDTGEGLAVVGKNYQPIQTSEVVGFVDEVLADTPFEINSMRSFRGGRLFMMRCISDKLFSVGKNKDKLQFAFNAVGSHDATHSLRMFAAIGRLVCTNGLVADGVSQSVSIRHTKNASIAVENEKEKFGTYVEALTELKQDFIGMYNTQISDEDLQRYFAQVFPISKDLKFQTRINNIHNQLHELYEHGKGANMATGTLWGAYNAVTEYVDHYRTVKGREGFDEDTLRAESINIGSGAKIKTLALTAAQKIIQN